MRGPVLTGVGRAAAWQDGLVGGSGEARQGALVDGSQNADWRVSGATARWLAVAALLTGVLLGLATSLSNVLGSPYSPASLSPDGVFALEVLAAVLGTPWAWAVVAFVTGWLAVQVTAGPIVGVVSLLTADLTYYLTDHVTGYAAFSPIEFLFWAGVAIPIGALMGLCGALTAQGSRWCIVPGLMPVVAVVAFARPSGSEHIQPWPAVLTCTAAAVLGVIAVMVWVRALHRHRLTQGTGGRLAPAE